MKKSVLIAILLLGLGSVLMGQTEEGRDIYYKRDTSTTIQIDTLSPNFDFRLLGTNGDGKNILRWAPVDEFSFVASLGKSYKLERFDTDGRSIDTLTRKVFDINPWSEEDFRPYLDLDEPYILAAGQAMYGAPEAQGSGATNFAGRAQEITNKRGIALLAADFDATAAEALA